MNRLFNLTRNILRSFKSHQQTLAFKGDTHLEKQEAIRYNQLQISFRNPLMKFFSFDKKSITT